MRRLAIALIRLYQLLISPLLPRACRFYPSCSQYAVDAIAQGGVLAGGWLALRRLARCHPWHPGGVDLVPHNAILTGAPAQAPARPLRAKPAGYPES